MVEGFCSCINTEVKVVRQIGVNIVNSIHIEACITSKCKGKLSYISCKVKVYLAVGNAPLSVTVTALNSQQTKGSNSNRKQKITLFNSTTKGAPALRPIKLRSRNTSTSQSKNHSCYHNLKFFHIILQNEMLVFTRNTTTFMFFFPLLCYA